MADPQELEAMERKVRHLNRVNGALRMQRAAFSWAQENLVALELRRTLISATYAELALIEAGKED